MARSSLTLSELHAAAMLLGLEYDPMDHTFCDENNFEMCWPDIYYIDPDTMDKVYAMELPDRVLAVQRKEIGACDG